MSRKEPSLRMKKTAKLAVENGGNVSKAMRDAGYSPAVASNPHKLKESPTWRELMEAYLPDDMLLRALSDDIESKKGNRTAELTLATKLKGRLTEKIDQTSNGEKIQPILVQFIDAPTNNNTDTN